MNTYTDLNDYDQLYKTMMSTEGNAIHSDPVQVFTALRLSDGDISDLFTEILQGPPNQFTDRCDTILGELTQRYVHHLIDIELGVD